MYKPYSLVAGDTGDAEGRVGPREQGSHAEPSGGVTDPELGQWNRQN